MEEIQQDIKDAATEDAVQVIKALIAKNPAITFRGIFLETGLSLHKFVLTL